MFDYFAPFYDTFLDLSQRYTIDPIINNVDFESKNYVLDVGGGTGYLGHRIKQKYDLNYFVLDQNKKMLKRANKKNLDGVILSKSSKLPIRDEAFDKILCTDALHHFKYKQKSLREFIRTLKCDGELIILELIPKKLITKIIFLIERMLGETTYFCSPDEISNSIEYELNYRKVNSFQYLIRAKKTKK